MYTVLSNIISHIVLMRTGNRQHNIHNFLKDKNSRETLTFCSVITWTTSSGVSDCAEEGDAAGGATLEECEYEVAELSRRLLLEDEVPVSAEPLGETAEMGCT